MALIKCPECGKDVSDKASACIHCGCPIEKQEVASYTITFKGYKSKWDSLYANELRKTLESKFRISQDEAMKIAFSSNYVVASRISEDNAKWIASLFEPNKGVTSIEKTNESINEELNTKYNKLSGKILVCPRCDSQNVTTGARGYNIVTVIDVRCCA